MTSAPASRWISRRWPALLTVLLVTQAAGMIWMVMIAGRDPGFAVEPNFYEKAVGWDEAARLTEASRRLGWTAEAGLSRRDAGGVRTLTVRLRDRLGRELDGAVVDVEAFHQARAADRIGVTLTADAPGLYAGTALLPRDGLYEVRLTVTRGPETWLQTQTLDAPGGRP